MPLSMEVLGVDSLRRKMTTAEKSVFPRAAARALNNTARSVRTQTVKDVSAAMGFKQASVRRRIVTTKRATPKDLIAVIEAKGKPLNLINFEARELKRGGVSHKAWGRRQQNKALFIRKMPNGKFIVVKRHERADKKISKGPNKGAPALQAVWGPGIAKEAAAEALARSRRVMVGTRLPMELTRELRFRVQRLRGG